MVSKRFVFVVLALWVDHCLAQPLLSTEELKNAKIFKSLEDASASEQPVYILDLSGQKLTDIPEGLERLDKLQVLNLSNTRISQVSDRIGQLTYLQKFNISHHQEANPNLSALPPNLSKLPYLEEIDLSGNPHLNWQLTIGQLEDASSLKILAVMNNDLNLLPEQVIGLSNLQQIWLGKNPGLDWKDALGKLSQLEELQQIGFGGCGFDTISFQQGTFPKVFNLWLAGNLLKSLPGIHYLEDLKSITLNNNQLHSLPVEMAQVVTLEHVSLNNNPQLDFEEAITLLSSLPNLRVLSIANNDLDSLPSNIEELRSLEYIILTDNNFSEEYVNHLKAALPKTLFIR